MKSMKSILELHHDLITKKNSVVELVEEYSKVAIQNKNNAFISTTTELALKLAKEADENLNLNLNQNHKLIDNRANFLYGIPYTLKDLFITKDLRTTAASKMLYNYIPSYDGFVSNTLKNTGAILMGKVSLDEFGMGSTNENSAFGPVLNPLNNEYVPGGSSGGSAASISEKSSIFSMGTDTGGSSRLPANFCGIVGFKPSYGRISRMGQIAYASSLDQASPMGNYVIDVACVFESLSQKDKRDATNINKPEIKLVADLATQNHTAQLKGLKIGISKELIEGCDDDIQKEILASVDFFKKAGAIIVDIKLPHISYSVSSYYLIATCEASSNLSRYDGIHYGARIKHLGELEDTYKLSRSYGFGSEVKKRIMLGTFSLSSGYYEAYYKKACLVRRLIANDFKEAFNICDVFLSPVCSTTAFKKGESIKDPLKMYMNDLYTIPANLIGSPSLAMPFGQGKNGLPTGFQLMTAHGEDRKLLKIGHAVEVLMGRIQNLGALV